MSRSQMLHSNNDKCRNCDESRQDAMTQRGRCYECMLIQDGRKRTEDHHPFGRCNYIVASIIVRDVPGNWHRAFDTRRASRQRILKQPGDNPLHQIAAVIATFGEAAETVVDFARREQWSTWIGNLAEIFVNAAESAVEWLLILAGKLDEWRGPAWIGEMPKWQP